MLALYPKVYLADDKRYEPLNDKVLKGQTRLKCIICLLYNRGGTKKKMEIYHVALSCETLIDTLMPNMNIFIKRIKGASNRFS